MTIEKGERVGGLLYISLHFIIDDVNGLKEVTGVKHSVRRLRGDEPLQGLGVEGGRRTGISI